MAYLANKEQKPPAAPGLGGVPSAAPTTGGGLGAGLAAAYGGSGGAPTSQATPGGQKGTGFVNAGTYMDLNKAGGQKMAGQVAGGIESAGDKFQKDVGDYRQGYADYQQKIAPAAGMVPGGAQDYAGYNPGGLSGLQSEASKLAAKAQLGGSQAGLGELLRMQYAQPGGYSSGARGLDAMLTASAGGARLAGDAARFGGAEGQVTSELGQPPQASVAPNTVQVGAGSPGGHSDAPAGGGGPVTHKPIGRTLGGGRLENPDEGGPAPTFTVPQTPAAAPATSGGFGNALGQQAGAARDKAVNGVAGAISPLKKGLQDFWGGMVGGGR